MIEAQIIRDLAEKGVFPKEIAKQLNLPYSAVIGVLRKKIVSGPKPINCDFDYAAFRAEVARRRVQFEQDWWDNSPYISEFMKTWNENGKPKSVPGRRLQAAGHP